MEAVVDEVEPLHLFTFHTERDGKPRTRWGWRLSPEGTSTQLTQSWERLAPTPALLRLVERVLLGGRIKHNQANLLSSLAKVKALAEH